MPSFLRIDLLQFLSFVCDDLVLSLCINFLADMFMHMFSHIYYFTLYIHKLYTVQITGVAMLFVQLLLFH